VNGERVAIQELQVTPMGIIQMIYPNTTDTQARIGLDVFQEVRADTLLAVCCLASVTLSIG
jgi:hypothetical protein